MAQRGWYWPWLLSAALLAVVGVNVVMLFAANSDKNGAVVEPDYYRKAVEWDSTLALRTESARLGWTATVTLEFGSEEAAGSVGVRLVDSSGAAVTGARTSAILIHNADAGNPVEVTLRETTRGLYAAAARLAHVGRWEVRVDARRASAHFVATLHADLVPPPSKASSGALAPVAVPR